MKGPTTCLIVIVAKKKYFTNEKYTITVDWNEVDNLIKR